MKKTVNYQLNQWDGSDRIMREDFNSDNAKIDAALAEQGAALTAQAAQIAKCGNCRIATQTYTGTGTYGSENKNTLTFDAPPLLVLVGGFQGTFMCLFPGHGHARLVFASSEYDNSVTWNGNSVSWYSYQSAALQFNASGSTYYAVAFFAED